MRPLAKPPPNGVPSGFPDVKHLKVGILLRPFGLPRHITVEEYRADPI